MKFRHQRALATFKKKRGYTDSSCILEEILFMICFLPQFDINNFRKGRVISGKMAYSFGIRGYTTITSPYSIYKPERNRDMFRIESLISGIYYDYSYKKRILCIGDTGLSLKI